jgi:hypothetical protein
LTGRVRLDKALSCPVKGPSMEIPTSFYSSSNLVWLRQSTIQWFTLWTFDSHIPTPSATNYSDTTHALIHSLDSLIQLLTLFSHVL